MTAQFASTSAPALPGSLGDTVVLLELRRMVRAATTPAERGAIQEVLQALIALQRRDADEAGPTEFRFPTASLRPPTTRA
jgi:hypothetical protein